MALQTRSIKRRLKSVRNTKKITKAMELVAGSKMRKAVNAVTGGRPYSSLAWATVASIAKNIETDLHPLLKRKSGPPKSILLLLITSDRGLAGGFNSNVVKAAASILKQYGPEVRIDAVCVGKRGADAMKRLGRPVIASFVNVTNNPRFEDILPIGRLVVDEFLKGSYDRVIIAYTDFVSALTQKPVTVELLPLKKEAGETDEEGETVDYNFEPSPKEVLDRILPRIVETKVYHAVLESTASEHSARMMAMRNASDSASDMIDSLNFTFNQARQAGITQEIAEISSGKAALES
jgi:F-type H+-transporting ATPase subunit gamma